MSRSIRTPLVAGNWKMNLDHIQAVDWMKSYSKSNNGWMERCKTNGMVTTPVELAVFPSFTSLGVISTMASKLAPGLGYGAQTISEPRSGAFTGDVSAGMLSALGCKYVILGHSEQRRYHPEDDGKIASKVKVVLDTGMQPIVCIGETKCGRDHGIGLDYALSQLADAVSLLSCDEMKKVIIAYEPVWAIGTGDTATIRQVESALSDIRDFVNADFGADVACAVRILYGGSVTPVNAASLIKAHDVDGFLIGGASLDPIKYAKIYHRVAENAVKRDPRPVAHDRVQQSFDSSDLSWQDWNAATALAGHREDTPYWRGQLALMAYRTVGFKYLEQKAVERAMTGLDASGVVTNCANHVASLDPDLLRDEIWSERLEIIGRFMILVEHGEVRGVDSVPEWLVEIDETLSQDEKYRKLVEARADWSARQAYGEIADDGMPFDLFCRVYKAGYMADDADTRNRHWRQRGVDKRVQPWRTV